MAATMTENPTDAEITARKIETAIATTDTPRLRMDTYATNGAGTFWVIRDGRKFEVTITDLGPADE